MSRIGKKPVKLEGGATVTLNGQIVTVAGPKGKLDYTLPPGISLKQENGQVTVSSESETRQASMFLGLARSLIQGMVVGVTAGYKKQLTIEGVGFRGQVSGQKLTMSLGFSHPIVYMIPEGLKITMPDNIKITVEGIDKQQVGEAAAQLRRFHPPDAYKGKGVRYLGEVVTLKEGKTVG